MATLALLLCAIIGGGAHAETSSPRVSDWTVVTSLLIVQSHRGAGVLAAENTTAAFEMGWKLGTYPEGDIRVTTDGSIVTFHDATFKRVTREVPPELSDKGVADVTYDTLRKLEVGEWKGEQFVGHQVPRLSDVFELMRGHPERHLYMDIKNVKLPQLAALVKEYGVGAQVVLASPKHAIIRHWKKLVPDSDTLLWIHGTEAEITALLNAARKDNYEGITQVQLHVQMKMDPNTIKRESMEPFNLSDEFLLKAGQELRSRGIVFQTLPYDAASREIYWKLLDLGVMSFATDHPDTTMDALREYYTMTKQRKAAQ